MKPQIFNIVAAVVMGAIAGTMLLLHAPDADKVCLACVSGLAGALAGAAKSQA